MNARRATIGLAVLGLAIHAFAVAFVHWKAGGIDAFAFRSLDAGEYHDIARNLLRHARFSAAEAPPLTPDSWRTPGYPLFLAAAMAVVGASPIGLILAQQLLSIVNGLLLFEIVQRHFGVQRAFVAACLVLIEPYGLYYSFWLLSTTWLTTLLMLTWRALDRAIDGDRTRWFAASGLLGGLLVLTWPGAILVPFALACIVLLRGRRSSTAIAECESGGGFYPRFSRVAVFGACCGIVVGTWMGRNAVVFGHWSLSHQSGVVLAYFKATEVELWRQERTRDRYVETSLNPDNEHLSHSVWSGIDASLRDRLGVADRAEGIELTWKYLAQGNKTSFDSFEVSRALTGIGWSMLWRSPGDTLTCCLARIGENLAFPLGMAVTRPAGVETRPLRSALIGAAYALLAIAAATGALRMVRRDTGAGVALACLVGLALATTPQVDPRFRVPMIPLLLYLAMAAIPAGAGDPHSSDGSSS